MDELEKNLRVNRLIDLYGSLLTGHQRQILSWYYSMDLSLAAISDQLGISRNGVYDALKKGVAVLEKYEENLHLLRRDEELDAYFEEIRKNCDEKERLLVDRIEKKVKEYGI